MMQQHILYARLYTVSHTKSYSALHVIIYVYILFLSIYAGHDSPTSKGLLGRSGLIVDVIHGLTAT